MSKTQIVLTPMAVGRDAEFAEMLEEFRAVGEVDAYRGDHAIAWRGYPAFYDLVSRMRNGGYPRPDIVPTEPYFIEEHERILGEVYIRNPLSPRLEKIGGHIGYKVRPSERNKGVATAALRLALGYLRELEIERALVTCHDSNVASARVIEKCGGERIEDAQTERGTERRYWVPTAPR